MVLFQKLFQGYIFCFLGDLFGRYVFEQYARETNLKKKRSVLGGGGMTPLALPLPLPLIFDDDLSNAHALFFQSLLRVENR